MTRVKVLSNGTFLTENAKGEKTFSPLLSKKLRSKYMLLRTADVHTRIENVGIRYDENLFLIDDEKNHGTD